jgi:CelD/BcsL family acetyltransferase involved in cellulose biosynthesis
MQISVIDSIEQYEQLKSSWDEVYSSDPDSTIFASWGWIRGWLDTKSCDWSVLAARPDDTSPFVAFMPLGMRVNKEGTFQKLFLGGSGHPGSDNTGFVCLPEYAEEAIPAFASFIQGNIKWDRLELRSVFDPRLDVFLKSFSQRSFYVEEEASNSCPHIMLPKSWDEYLKNFLSRNARKNLQSYTRKLEGLRDFHVTHARRDTLETHVEALLSLWQDRFGQKPAVVLDRYRAIYRRCFESDCLLLTMLWDGKVPVAGKAAFIGRKRKAITAFTTGFNENYAAYRPGNVLTGYVIRYAIENGFRIYDFGEGAENHKFGFGATERFNRNVNITPNGFLSILKGKVPAKVKKIMRMPVSLIVKKVLTRMPTISVLIFMINNFIPEDAPFLSDFLL